MPSFNLIDRSWLPCVTPDGAGREVSVRQALLQAHEHRELYDPSPLVTVALHRLLLVILYRAYQGPSGIEEWSEVWRAGRFDPWRINAYLDQDEWRTRFDLFDAERPFYQVPFIAGEKPSPIWRLAQEATSGNNVTLFDHRVNDRPAPMSPAMAARYVVAAQALAVAGGVSNPFNFNDGPITRGFTLLALGESLFETLALNLQPYDEYRPIPSDKTRDVPAWERDELRTPTRGGTSPAGYLDYLTWQSRQLHLIPEDDFSVRWCQVRQRFSLPADPPIDPFKVYRIDPKLGRRPLSFAPSRALWRDSTALLAQTEPTTSGQRLRRPELSEWLAQIDQCGLLADRRRCRFCALGITAEGSAARIILWRREELPVPLALLSLPPAIAVLREASNAAEDAGRILSQSARHLAEMLLPAPLDKAGNPKPDPEAVAKLAKNLALEQRFWPRLEAPFADLLATLPDDTSPHPDNPRVVRYGVTAKPEWAKAVRTAAESAFNETATGLDRSARSLKAVASVRGRFRGSLNKALAPLEESERSEDGEAA